MFVVRRLVEIIERAGVPRQQILRAADITEKALEERDTAVPLDLVERMCEVVSQPTVDPALGVTWIQYLTAHTFGPVSHALIYSADLRQALELVLRYEALFCDQRIFELEEEGDMAVLRLLDWNVRSADVLRFMTEMIVAGFSAMLRAYNVAVERVCFRHAAPDYRAEYIRIFGPIAQFDQPFAGIEFERAALDRGNPHFDAEVCAALAAVLERRVVRSTEDVPYSVRVREILTQQRPECLNIQSTARRLGLSERSLRRRLAAEGISFRAIQESVLTAMAQQLLQERRFTIKETAHAMGFSDATTFHRAFKRWTGTTPRSPGSTSAADATASPGCARTSAARAARSASRHRKA